jgi:hypothetical protein
MVSRESSVGIVAGCTTEELRVESWQGQEIVLLSTAFRPALRPTQLPVQWMSENLSARVKWQEREAGRSPPSSVEAKNGGVIRPLPQMSS